MTGNNTTILDNNNKGIFCPSFCLSIPIKKLCHDTESRSSVQITNGSSSPLEFPLIKGSHVTGFRIDLQSEPMRDPC